MHAQSLSPGQKEAPYDGSGHAPLQAGTRDVRDRSCDTHPPFQDDRWPPLVRVCVTVGCGVLAWATLLAPAWYLLSY
jgi:hypothetical protein